jgi:hypothetical protein
MERATDDAVSRRTADRTLAGVLVLLVVAVQLLVRQHECALPETTHRYSYSFGIVGGIVVFAFVFKCMWLEAACSYLLLYALLAVWLVPHDAVRTVPFFSVLWLGVFVLYVVWAVWRDFVPLAEVGPRYDFARIVHSGYNIVNFARDHGAPPPATSPPARPARSGLRQRPQPDASAYRGLPHHAERADASSIDDGDSNEF